MATAATRDLTDGQSLHQAQPADLRPLLHADHPFLLTSVEDDRASVETTSDEAEVVQFSTGVGGPVFSRRRHLTAPEVAPGSHVLLDARLASTAPRAGSTR